MTHRLFAVSVTATLTLTLCSGCFSPNVSNETATETDAATGTGASSGDTTADGPTTNGPTSTTTDTTDTSPTTGDPDTTATTGEAAECDEPDLPCPDGQYCVTGSCEDPPEGMVAVPAGPFMMGCNEELDSDCAADEFPYHEVWLDAFAIDRTEVTKEAYLGCVEDGVCTPPHDTYVGGMTPCDWDLLDSDAPIVCVVWSQAKAFCEWAGKELPTEAQWEKAARGTDGRVYPWGNETPTCNHVPQTGMCGQDVPVSVGSFPAGASPYGALDMAGNAFEWTADWYAASYYLESPSENPTGPTTGMRRVVRSANVNYLGAAWRNSFRAPEFEFPTPMTAYPGGGFRCAKSP